MIDIIITTALKNDLFFKLIESLKKQKLYEPINISVCYTGTYEYGTYRIENALKDIEHTVIGGKYHYAENQNEMVKRSSGDYLLFLNDDVEFTNNLTIQYMLDLVKCDEIGTVGLKLLYPDGTIQHYGQSLYTNNEGQFVGVNHFCHRQNDIYNADIRVVGNTFACCLVKREDWIPLDEHFRRCFEDVIFNWKMLAKGKTNVCVGAISAIHHESQTRGANDISPTDTQYLVYNYQKLEAGLKSNAKNTITYFTI